jgi:phospholipid/cholesterol/gamma-HCH transport system permease protein
MNAEADTPTSFTKKVITSVGQRILDAAYILGGIGILLRYVYRDLRRKPLHVYLVVEQLYFIGVKSLSLVLITAMSTGMVMALQFGFGLAKFGGKLYVPKLVALSMVREMAPVFCSLMLAARVGAGIASEIGSMKVTQQIDAIRALGTSPIKRIVIPRILACLIAAPLLVALGNAFGILGSLAVEVWELGLDPMFCLEKMFTTVQVKDYLTGIGKTLFFAFFISVTSCYFGMNVRGGTQGVGTATTRAVVVSSVMILIGDFFLTKAFFFLFER